MELPVRSCRQHRARRAVAVPRLLAGAVPASRLALEPSPQPSLVYFPIPWITAANVSLKTALPCHRLLFSLRVSLTPENGN